MIEISYKKILKFSPKNIYDIVADIESYSQFIPGCFSSKIISKEGSIIEAKLGVKYLIMSGVFISRVTFDPRKLSIVSEGINGPFNSVFTKWSFDRNDNGVLVKVSINLDLSNKVFELLLKKNLEKVFSQVVVSFEERADILY